MKIKIFKGVYVTIIMLMLGYLLFVGNYEIVAGIRDVVIIMMFMLIIVYGVKGD
jgi:hypothetical protein